MKQVDAQLQLLRHKYLLAYHHRQFQNDLEMKVLELQMLHLLQMFFYQFGWKLIQMQP